MNANPILADIFSTLLGRNAVKTQHGFEDLLMETLSSATFRKALKAHEALMGALTGTTEVKAKKGRKKAKRGRKMNDTHESRDAAKETATKKRGRPKGSKNKPKATLDVAEAKSAVVEMTPQEKVQESVSEVNLIPVMAA